MSEDPRWLSKHEQRAWRRFVAAIGLLSEHLDRRMQRDAGMPHTYYEVLVALSEAPELTLRMSELATRSRFSRSRLSHAVTKLEAKGWVTRASCPTDKRGALATLSEQGLAVLRSAAPDHVDAVREAVFDVLSEQQVNQLSDIAGAISDQLASGYGVADTDASR